MQRLLITWEIGSVNCDTIYRYCPGCGEKVGFKDSLKKRRNANGKIIYEYAIYKCDHEHTWNKLINTYGAKHYVENLESNNLTENTGKVVDIVPIEYCLNNGIVEIEIFIKHIEGNWRLDKLLACYLEGISRNQIEKKIKSGKILVDNEEVKTKTTIKEGQRILIILT